MKNPDTRLCVGVFAAPHGVKGIIKLRSHTADPLAIFDYGTLQDEHGKPLRLKFAGQSGSALLAQVEGVNTREMAQLLTNRQIYLLRKDLPEPAEDSGEFYIEDLIGLRVKLADDREIGKIVQFYNFGAGDILEIAFNNGTLEMFSFTDATFPTIDIAKGIIEFHPPEVVEAKPR